MSVIDINIWLLAAISFLFGFVLSYFYQKASSVRRSSYDQLKEELMNTSNQLSSIAAKEEELRSQNSVLEEKLNQEITVNKEQEKSISQLEASIHHLDKELDKNHIEKNKQEQLKELLHQEVMELKSNLTKVNTLKSSLESKLNQQDEDFQDLRKKSLLEFENIANRLFEEKTSTFSKVSKENLEQLLSPLKENLSEFKKKVEETYDKESKQRFSLESKIKDLVELNQQISKDATNLTNALRGSSKTQGSWGEMILESILERSGLVKNREYFLQASFVDKNGNRKQPDVKIKYPDDRYIIIDSKVSLTAYDRFVNAEEAEEQKLYLSEHVRSLKNHIDNLSAKEYDQFDKTLDFVMLFVPIEPAYLTALQYDNELWNYAYKKRILLISPTNLLAVLKMVSDIWKREHQNNNAIAIAKRGELLYEKFVSFVEDLEEIDKHIGKAGQKYNDAMNKLSKGAGNLIGQADKLRQLGIHTKKELPEKYTG